MTRPSACSGNEPATGCWEGCRATMTLGGLRPVCCGCDFPRLTPESRSLEAEMRVAKEGHALVTTGGAGEAKRKKRTLEVRRSRTREPTLAGERGGEGDLEPAGPTSLAEGNDQDGRGNGDQEQRRWQRRMYEHQRHGVWGFLGGG